MSLTPSRYCRRVRLYKFQCSLRPRRCRQLASGSARALHGTARARAAERTCSCPRRPDAVVTFSSSSPIRLQDLAHHLGRFTSRSKRPSFSRWGVAAPPAGCGRRRGRRARPRRAALVRSGRGALPPPRCTGRPPTPAVPPPPVRGASPLSLYCHPCRPAPWAAVGGGEGGPVANRLDFLPLVALERVRHGSAGGMRAQGSGRLGGPAPLK